MLLNFIKYIKLPVHRQGRIRELIVNTKSHGGWVKNSIAPAGVKLAHAER